MLFRSEQLGGNGLDHTGTPFWEQKSGGKGARARISIIPVFYRETVYHYFNWFSFVCMKQSICLTLLNFICCHVLRKIPLTANLPKNQPMESRTTAGSAHLVCMVTQSNTWCVWNVNTAEKLYIQ